MVQKKEVAGYVARIVKSTRCTTSIFLEGDDDQYVVWKPRAIASQAISHIKSFELSRPPAHCFVLQGAFVRICQRSRYYDIDFIDYECGDNERRGRAAFRDLFSPVRGRWIRNPLLRASPRIIDDLLNGEFRGTSWDLVDQLNQARICLSHSGAYNPCQLDVLSEAASVLIVVNKCFDFRKHLVEETNGMYGITDSDIDHLSKFAFKYRIRYDEVFMQNPLKCIKSKKPDVNVDTSLWDILELLSVKYGVSNEDIDAEYLDSLMLELMKEGGHMCIPTSLLEKSLVSKKRNVGLHCLERADYFVQVHVEGDRFVYRKDDYGVERESAKKLRDILSQDDDEEEEDDDEVDVPVSDWLSSEQEAAKKRILYNSNVLAVSGFPGTGKSRLAGHICEELLKKMGYDEESILILAPTGKAVDRLRNELEKVLTVSKRVMTIHRSFTFVAESDSARPNLGSDFRPNFGYDMRSDFGSKRATYAESARFVIVDEMSMVSARLFHKLLSYLNAGVKLLLLGDPDQLPSIDRGEVFSEILRSQVPVVRLTKNFRQNGNPENTIWPLAQSIMDPEKKIRTSFLRSDSVTWIETCDKQRILEELKEIHRRERDLQILAPQKIGDVGLLNINAEIHHMLYGGSRIVNPKESDLQKMLCGGERVIITKNGKTDSDEEYFNGQIGVLTLCEDEEENQFGIVKIKDKCVEVDLPHLTMAHGISVHKSQGSEYDVVALVLHASHSRMLNRKLVYTAITRAKKKLYVLSDRDTLAVAKNKACAPRYSLLSHMLNAYV